MYIRRKVFSLHNLNEYYIQKLYNESENSDKEDSGGITPYVVGGVIGTGAGYGTGHYHARKERQRIKNAEADIEEFQGRNPEIYKQEYIRNKQKEKEAKLAAEKNRHDLEVYRNGGYDETWGKGGDKTLENEYLKHEKEVGIINTNYKDIISEAENKAKDYAKHNKGQVEKRLKFMKANERLAKTKHTLASLAGMGAGISAAALYNGIKSRTRKNKEND